jgi:hypothetical protein
MPPTPGFRFRRFSSHGPVLSVGMHAAILLVVAVWMHHIPRIAPFKLPGTARGLTLLTYYSPGSRKLSGPHQPRHKREGRKKARSRR